jgi:hypothetical protein
MTIQMNATPSICLRELWKHSRAHAERKDASEFMHCTDLGVNNPMWQATSSEASIAALRDPTGRVANDKSRPPLSDAKKTSKSR